MRYQSTDHFCGPAAVANALKSLGRNITEQQVEAAVAKSQRKGEPKSVEGTTQGQIKRALEVLKCGYQEFSLAHTEAAWGTLRSYMMDGHPVLLCVDDNEHWVSGIGVLGPRVLVVDGTDSELVLSYNKEEMLKRWGCPGDVVTYYGLPIISKRRSSRKPKAEIKE